MTEDGKWLEEQLNLQRIVDCAGEVVGLDRDTVTVAEPHAVLTNAVIGRVDTSKGRRRGSGRLINITGDYPVFSNLVFDGPMTLDDFLKPGGSEGSQVEGEHGLGIMGVTSPVLRNVYITNFYGDGIFFGSRGGSRNAKQVVNALLDNVRVYNTGRHSIAITSMDGGKITGGSRFEYARRNPIDREIVHPVDKIRRVEIDPDTVRCNRSKILRGRC